jgi:hypothetical protein
MIGIPTEYTEPYTVDNITYPAITSGCFNTISLNNMNCITNNGVSCSGYAVNINSETYGNIVCDNNIYTNASKGLTNIKTNTCS